MSVLKANSSDILKHSKLSKKEEVNSYLRKKKKKNALESLTWECHTIWKKKACALTAFSLSLVLFDTDVLRDPNSSISI